MTIRLALCGFL